MSVLFSHKPSFFRTNESPLNSDLFHLCSTLGRLDKTLIGLLLTQCRHPQFQIISPKFLSQEEASLGLRRRGLTSAGVSPRKCIPDSSLTWGALGQSDALSKTTKLILLDSLLQEVCIRSGSAGRSSLSSLTLSVCLVQSHSIFLQD